MQASTTNTVLSAREHPLDVAAGRQSLQRCKGVLKRLRLRLQGHNGRWLCVCPARVFYKTSRALAGCRESTAGVRCSTWRLKLPFVEQADFNGLQYRKLDQASVAQNREERQEAEVTQPELRSHYSNTLAGSRGSVAFGDAHACEGFGLNLSHQPERIPLAPPRCTNQTCRSTAAKTRWASQSPARRAIARA